MEPVDPDDLTERTSSVEDHLDADWMTRPEGKGMAIMSNAVQRGLPSNSSHSPVRFPRYRQTQTGLVGVLDLLLLQTDEPLQSQTPVLRHSGVQVLQEGQKDMRLAEVLIISWAITTLQVIRTSLAFSLSNLQQFSLSLTHTQIDRSLFSVYTW